MTVSALFAKRLKALREARGLSQSQLADAVGISRGSISYYENGERVPDIVVLAQIKDFFRVKLDYLLGYTNEKYDNVRTYDAITELPQYVQGRITSISDYLVRHSGKWIPSSGDDPYLYFDFVHNDVITILEAYQKLMNDSKTGDKTKALAEFKANLDRTSEMAVAAYILQNDRPVKTVIEVFPKPEGEPQKKRRRR